MMKTNKGRIVAFIIDKEIYIFEFKFNRDKDRALNLKNIMAKKNILDKRDISWTSLVKY